MKLTNREKILLMVLGICIVLAALYYGVVRPQLNFVGKLESRAKEYSQEIKAIMKKASPDNPVYKEYKIVNAKTQNILERYYPSIIQEKIILTLDKFIKNSGIKAVSITFSEVDLLELAKAEDIEQLKQSDSSGSKKSSKAESTQAEQKKDAAENKSKTAMHVERMNAALEFEGTYSQLYSFLNALEQENRSIKVFGLEAASNSSGSLSGTILIDIYSIEKPFEQDQEYLSWDIQGDYGKADPFGYMQGFVPSTAAAGPVNTQPTGLTSIVERDFFIAIRPISSDLPTITIGKFDDKDRSTYVYADNTGYENVELQIVQDGDKFYYGYKTQEYYYPKGYSKELVEFKPLGNELQLAVISSARNKDKDVNGVSLSVINKTTLPLKIYVKNDDAAMPRLKLNKLEGSVSVVQDK